MAIAVHSSASARRSASRQHRAPVALDEMLDEEVELPGQLLDVEGDPIGQVPIGLQLGAAPLQQRDERDGVPVQRRVLGRRRGSQMCLQRDVAQIFERHDAVGIRVAENRGDRQRHLLEQRGHVREGQRLEVDAPRVQREHHRVATGQDHAKVAPVGCVACERHDSFDPRDIVPLACR